MFRDSTGSDSGRTAVRSSSGTSARAPVVTGRTARPGASRAKTQKACRSGRWAAARRWRTSAARSSPASLRSPTTSVTSCAGSYAPCRNFRSRATCALFRSGSKTRKRRTATRAVVRVPCRAGETSATSAVRAGTPAQEEDDEGARGDGVRGAPADEAVDLEEVEPRRRDEEGERKEDGERRERPDRDERAGAGDGGNVAQEDVEADVDEDRDEDDPGAPPDVLPPRHPGEGEEVDEDEEVDREGEERDPRPPRARRVAGPAVQPPPPEVEPERHEGQEGPDDVGPARAREPRHREEAADRDEDPADGHEVDGGRPGEGDPVLEGRPVGDRPEDPPRVQDPEERQEREEGAVRGVEGALEEDDDRADVVDAEDEERQDEPRRRHPAPLQPEVGEPGRPRERDDERQDEGRDDDALLAGSRFLTGAAIIRSEPRDAAGRPGRPPGRLDGPDDRRRAGAGARGSRTSSPAPTTGTRSVVATPADRGFDLDVDPAAPEAEDEATARPGDDCRSLLRTGAPRADAG